MVSDSFQKIMDESEVNREKDKQEWEEWMAKVSAEQKELIAEFRTERKKFNRTMRLLYVLLIISFIALLFLT